MHLLAALPTGSLADHYWVHPWNRPFLVQFTDTIGIHYYGLAYVLAFLVGGWLLRQYSRRGCSPLTADQSYDFLFALVLGVLLGGRLGYFLLYWPGLLLHDPLVFFRVWEGGMASHGGFLGVAAAILWFARRTKTPFWRLADLTVTIVPQGLLLGRIANFINGELWGRTTDVAWAVIFPQSDPGLPVDRILPRHPSQLYEAGLEGLLLFVYLQLRFWCSRTAAERPGRLSGEFLLGYALVRSFCEQFREPDAGLILGLSRGTFYSLFLAAAGIALLVWTRRRPDRTS